MTAAQIRERCRQGNASSGAQGATSQGGAGRQEVAQATDAGVDPQRSVANPVVTIEPSVVVLSQRASEKRPATSVPAPKRKKAKATSEKDIIDGTKEVYLPDWNIGLNETVFGTSGTRVDCRELLRGIFLPEDRKKLEKTSLVEGFHALTMLAAKVK